MFHLFLTTEYAEYTEISDRCAHEAKTRTLGVSPPLRLCTRINQYYLAFVRYAHSRRQGAKKSDRTPYHCRTEHTVIPPHRGSPVSYLLSFSSFQLLSSHRPTVAVSPNRITTEQSIKSRRSKGKTLLERKTEKKTVGCRLRHQA